ncbi:MAG: manganese efflux pump [Pyramidobacter sp.]|nr:manganese efflux pump [Pyramidobacter sp.]
MRWELLFFVNSALLGVGLAMNAFSVSLVNGLNELDMGMARAWRVSGVYAFFQWFMPMAGWLCVRLAVEKFKAFEPFIPWIAFLLLLWIGGEMLLEGLRGSEHCETANSVLTPWTLFVQGIATSIDALSVGFAIASYDWKAAMTASLIIAGVTWLICRASLALGRMMGTRLSGRAGVLGGIILIAIGAEILLKSYFI